VEYRRQTDEQIKICITLLDNCANAIEALKNNNFDDGNKTYCAYVAELFCEREARNDLTPTGVHTESMQRNIARFRRGRASSVITQRTAPVVPTVRWGQHAHALTASTVSPAHLRSKLPIETPR
jgi:hypothetical protein